MGNPNFLEGDGVGANCRSFCDMSESMGVLASTKSEFIMDKFCIYKEYAFLNIRCAGIWKNMTRT